MRGRNLTLLMIGLLAAAGADQANAAWRHRYTNQSYSQPAYSHPAYSQPVRSNYAGGRSVVWPYSPNYGNAVGAAYGPAAGMRQGQFFGTFGLRPADARARGAY